MRSASNGGTLSRHLNSFFAYLVGNCLRQRASSAVPNGLCHNGVVGHRVVSPVLANVIYSREFEYLCVNLKRIHGTVHTFHWRAIFVACFSRNCNAIGTRVALLNRSKRGTPICWNVFRTHTVGLLEASVLFVAAICRHNLSETGSGHCCSSWVTWPTFLPSSDSPFTAKMRSPTCKAPVL